MKSDRAKHNLFAVSAASAEGDINVERDTDTTLLVELGDIPNIEPRRENNTDECNGKEEADVIYDLGGLASISCNFNKAQCQHFAFVLAYALGSISTVAAGTGYEHTITPIDGDLSTTRSNPSFTGVFRYGDSVLKRRFASMFIESFTATFTEDDWVKLTASVKGTGKVTKNTFEETISAPKNSTELTLDANGIHGSTDEERLDNIHSVLAETATDVWEGVDVTAVSDATPGVLTITAPGVETDTINFKVLYVPVEDSWCSIPPKVVESALRVSQCTVNVGGTWDGSAFIGGRDISTNVKSIEYACNNNLEVKFGFGAGGAYASRCVRNGREQTLKLNKDFRDTLMQNRIDNNETFGVRILAEGAMFDDPHKYQVELIFPMVGVLSAPISADGKKLAEAGDLTVLEHETHGSVIAKVKNEVAAYAG